MKRYKTIFFDLDDTLIDTQGNALRNLDSLYTDYNLERFFPSADAFTQKFVKENSILWQKYNIHEISKEELLEQRFLIPFQEFPELSKEYLLDMNDDYLIRMRSEKTIMDGCFETLDYLSEKYEMHILSNGFTEMQYDKIENAGLSEYFDKVFLSDAIGVNKPDVKIFEYALEHCKAEKSTTIMIGDNMDTDIAGAKNAGLDQIWYNPASKSADVKPTHTITHLKDLKDLL